MVKAIVATVQAKDDKVEALKSELASLIKQTHQEAGNLSYEVFQETATPTKFQVFEIYQDEAAFKTHMNSHYMQDFENKLDNFVVEGSFEITDLTPIGS